MDIKTGVAEMKLFVSRAVLSACFISLTAFSAVHAVERVGTHDDSAMTLENLSRLAGEKLQNVEALIRERKIAERNAANEAQAREAYERGVQLSSSGDFDGAKKAWKEALDITQSPEMREYVAEQNRLAKLSEEQAAVAQRAAYREEVVSGPRTGRPGSPSGPVWTGEFSLSAANELKAAVEARINLINAEGEALFREDRIDDAEGKFRAVLRLDAKNLKAGEYVGSLIPARRETLRRIAASEQKAKAVFDRGSQLYDSGDLIGARTAWVEAINTTEIPATKLGMKARIDQLDAEIAVVFTKIDGLNREGVALFETDSLAESAEKFRAVLALDGTNIKAMEYLEVSIPNRKAFLLSKKAGEEKAGSFFEQGNQLYASGDIPGALAAWQNALATTENEALKAKATTQIAMAQERKRQELESFQARVAGLYAEGVALFDVGRFEASATKFNEVLALNSSHWGARQYLNNKIPGMKAELTRKSKVERDAQEAMEQGNKLYAAGNFEEAQDAWKKALEITQQR